MDACQIDRGVGKDIDNLRRVFDRCSFVELIYIHTDGSHTPQIKHVIRRLNIYKMRLYGLNSKYDA